MKRRSRSPTFQVLSRKYRRIFIRPRTSLLQLIGKLEKNLLAAKRCRKLRANGKPSLIPGERNRHGRYPRRIVKRRIAHIVDHAIIKRIEGHGRPLLPELRWR